MTKHQNIVYTAISKNSTMSYDEIKRVTGKTASALSNILNALITKGHLVYDANADVYTITKELTSRPQAFPTQQATKKPVFGSRESNSQPKKFRSLMDMVNYFSRRRPPQDEL